MAASDSDQADADDQRRWQITLQQRREHVEKYARTNAALLRTEWRQKLRGLTAQKLKRNLGVTEELFQNGVERQQRLQQATIRDARGLGDMFKEAFASHDEELRTLQKLQHSRMAALQQQFEDQLDSMAAEFVEEAAVHRQCHERQQAAIAGQVRALEAQNAATRKQEASVLAAQKEAIVNADIEDQAVLRMPFDERKAELQVLHHHVQKEHQDTMAGLADSLKQLTASASSHDAALHESRAQIAALEAELSRWRSKLAASGREWTGRNGGLRVQVHTVRRHCSDLRAGMERFQADHDSDLRQLCIESNTQQQRLHQQLATAQRLLKMVALCSDMAHQHGEQDKQGAHEASQLQQQRGMPAQPSYDCGLLDDAGGIQFPRAPTSPLGQQIGLLDAAVQQLHTALGRKQEVRQHVLQLKSEAAAQQLDLAQQRRNEDRGVVGVQCLPHTRTPDLLQVN